MATDSNGKAGRGRPQLLSRQRRHGRGEVARRRRHPHALFRSGRRRTHRDDPRRAVRRQRRRKLRQDLGAQFPGAQGLAQRHRLRQARPGLHGQSEVRRRLHDARHRAARHRLSRQARQEALPHRRPFARRLRRDPTRAGAARPGEDLRLRVVGKPVARPIAHASRVQGSAAAAADAANRSAGSANATPTIRRSSPRTGSTAASRSPRPSATRSPSPR